MYKEPNSSKINSMFSDIAADYDMVNSVLSLGIHHMWKNKLVELSKVGPNMKVLDCATGTGDLAIKFKKKGGPTTEVVGTDFCEDILKMAPQKAIDKGLDIKFEVADVTDLQYEDNSFDISCISFGIRNVGNLDKAFTELSRVTKPGGKVMILEFGQPNTPIFKDIYQFYSEKILPKLGGALSGQHEAYDYLNESAKKFPCREDFTERAISTSKYKNMTFTPVFMGVAYIYVGTPS